MQRGVRREALIGLIDHSLSDHDAFKPRRGIFQKASSPARGTFEPHCDQGGDQELRHEYDRITSLACGTSGLRSQLEQIEESDTTRYIRLRWHLFTRRREIIDSLIPSHTLKHQNSFSSG
jgi:hypothetical protein